MKQPLLRAFGLGFCRCWWFWLGEALSTRHFVTHKQRLKESFIGLGERKFESQDTWALHLGVLKDSWTDHITSLCLSIVVFDMGINLICFLEEELAFNLHLSEPCMRALQIPYKRVLSGLLRECSQSIFRSCTRIDASCLWQSQI